MAKHITSGLGVKLAEFNVSSSTEDTVLEDVRPLASYSWLEAKTPTIIVPGAPPTWRNIRVTNVRKDHGKTLIDQNAARMRSASPLEPLFTAVEEMGQRGALQQHQFICDRNSLRRLLKWVRKTEGSKSEDFRIDVDLAGSTCLLTRVEKKATSFITAFQGYGHEYEKASTKWPAGSEGATSHHRIISLKLGGIPIILRCEIDGCVNTSEEDKLSKISKGIKGTNSSSPTSTTVIRGVRVKKSPNPLTPQSSLLEIKTRSAAKPRINWSDVYPQIFFSQTEYLYIARHNDGSFGPVEKHSLTGASLDKHAQSTKASLGKLKDLLESIHNSVLEHGVKTRLTLVCMQGKLGLYHRKGGKIISGDVLSWFAA